MNRIISTGLLLAVACGDTTTTPPGQLNLDRPVDVAFTCYGGMRVTNGGPADVNQDVTVTAMPTSACETRSAPRGMADPVPVPTGQEDLTAAGGLPIPNVFWFTFILQSGPGTVALVQFPTRPASQFQGSEVTVLDADPLTPGKNGISVGEEPIAIATDTAGCTAITANAGSCDLSVIDVSSVLGSARAIVNRLQVKNAAGMPINAKPHAMVAEPSSKTIGNVCPVDDAGHAKGNGLVYIAYPNCHLVAGVDAATGTIVTGIQFDATGAATIVDGNVTCPDECAGEPVTAGTRPVTVDLELDPREDVASRRMVIGAANSPALTIVELDAASKPTTLSQIVLENKSGNLGINKVALSPTMGMGGEAIGSIPGTVVDVGAPGGQSQFVYAIASDQTVRVADVLNLNKECDTQVDPRFLRDIRSIRDLACLPVGEATTPPRRAGARSPGIHLIGDAVPTSLDFYRSDIPVGDQNKAPQRYIGYFAMIASSTGQTFVVNVDDDEFDDLRDLAHPLATPMPKVVPHQLRDGLGGRGQLAEEGRIEGTTTFFDPLCQVQNPLNDVGGVQFGPRATSAPLRNNTVGSIADTKITQLPTFRQLKCVGKDTDEKGRALSELSFSAPEGVRAQVFPDLLALPPDETWTATYEGALSVDTPDSNVDGPAIRESQLVVDAAGLHMTDQTAPFCDMGVEQFDIVQMRGCDPSQGDAQCPNGYRCFVHPESQIAGLGACMLDEEADRLATACKDYLTSIRRYTVARSTTSELLMLPRRHELRTSPLDGCVDDNQCKVLADYSRTLVTPDHPVLDMTTKPEERLYQCVADPTRPPVATGKRCELRCDTTADCIGGTVCQGAGAAGTKTGFCMEGIAPPQACVNAPQRYEVRAGYAFSVVGTATGYVHSTIQQNGTCVKRPLDPTAPNLDVGRIPLKAPACAADADPITGFSVSLGGFEPNPCSTTVANTDVVPRYVPGLQCVLDDPPTELVERQAPAIRFRNRGMTVHLVDPTYPGDSKTGCILDRQGGLVGVPTVFPNYQLQFRVNAGFAPVVVPVAPAFPVKVLRGPTNSMWIVDEGDFLSTSVAQPSTRGKVFRVEGHALGVINLMD